VFSARHRSLDAPLASTLKAEVAVLGPYHTLSRHDIRKLRDGQEAPHWASVRWALCVTSRATVVLRDFRRVVVIAENEATSWVRRQLARPERW